MKSRKPVFTAERKGGLKRQPFTPAYSESRCYTEGAGLDRKLSIERYTMIEPGPDQI
jgi:hypothetical protein